MIQIILVLLKLLFAFILLYLCIFALTLTVGHIVTWWRNNIKLQQIQEEQLKKRPQQKIKVQKEINKKWNKELGVWEIEG